MWSPPRPTFFHTSYDGDGKRVKKYVPDTGEVTVFVYDASGKSIAEYSTIVAISTDAKVNYLTSDHLGSPRINTDAAGSIIARHDYHPFGEEIYGTGGRTTGLNYGDDSVRKQFTGYERDAEVDLDFAQARMYSNGLGRFMVTDPELLTIDADDPQTWNLYAYVRNNPEIIVDIDGKQWRVCDNQNNCVVISDADAKKTLFNRDGNAPEIIRKDGGIYDRDGNQLGSYERISFDDFTDAQNDLFFGSGRLIESSEIRRPVYDAAGHIINFFGSMPAEGAGQAVEGVLTQGNKVIAEVESAINAVRQTATIVKSSKTEILEKVEGGLAEAAKDFNQLAKVANKVVTQGETRIAYLKNGMKAVLRRGSSDGRITVEIQKTAKEIGKGAAKNIKIRYGK